MDLDIGCSFTFVVPVATHAVMLFEPHSTDVHRVVDSGLAKRSMDVLDHFANHFLSMLITARRI